MTAQLSDLLCNQQVVDFEGDQRQCHAFRKKGDDFCGYHAAQRDGTLKTGTKGWPWRMRDVRHRKAAWMNLPNTPQRFFLHERFVESQR